MVNLLVYFFSIILIVSSIMVIVAKNPLHSVLFLVGSFLSSSIILFLFENEFLALFFLIIYLGAIAVLFLFVVMMLNIKYTELQNSMLYFPVGVFIGVTILIEVLGAVSKIFSSNTDITQTNHNHYLNWYDSLDSLPDLYVLGQIFYTHYVLQILMAGLILYLSTIGVAFLTIKSSVNKDKRRDQSIFRQLSRKNVL
uniref:NADH dehydrogenase subunit 6 n=1 Tax=Nitzschia dissipata TaxID=303402 RepID=UPI00202893C7|nr:NADH dehydrogenase subunit 6 [Nitzschia dissipata]QYB23067.1 NADH dehydrogenase subunit 6 [Nitzschia dissipata]